MRCRFIASLTAATVLSACSPQSRSVPKLNDQQAVAAAMRSLSPWKDGKPDQSNDGLTQPEEGSDRMMFRNWVQRYSSNEVNQHLRNYQPMAIPSSIGALLDEERRFEEQQRAQYARREAEEAKRQAEAQAQTEAEARTVAETEHAHDPSGDPNSRQFDQDDTSETAPQAVERPTAPTEQPWADNSAPSADFMCRIGREQAKAAAQSQAERDRAWNISCPSDHDKD